MIKTVEFEKKYQEEDVFLKLRITQFKNQIILERDLFDSKSICYSIIDGAIIISDSCVEIINFLKLKKEKLRVDFHYISGYLAHQAPYTSHTLFRVIKIIRPGETVVVNPLGERKSTLKCFTEGVPISSNDFRKNITESLQKINLKETCFHISSGLDSTLLAIKAAEIYPRETIKLATCMCRGEGSLDEIENIKLLTDEIKADLKIFDFRDVDIFKKGGMLVSGCLGYPIAHPSHLVEFLLDEQIVKHGATTIVNGKGPDDCLAGYPWHLPAFAKSRNHQERLTVTSKDECDSMLKINNHKQIWSGWDNAENCLGLSTRLIYDIQSLGEAWNIIHCAIGRYFNVNIVSPFMDPELRRGLFAIDDSKKLSNGVQKIFLRDTFLNNYPEYLLNFPKKGFRLDLKPYFLDYGESELNKLIIGDVDFFRRFFSISYIKKMIFETMNNGKNYGWQLWSLFCLKESLKEFNI